MTTNEQTVEQGIGATYEDADHFSISGDAQFVNTVNSGLEVLEEFVSFSALHNSSAQDPQRRCHPGTREMALGEIRKWADDPSTILWLHGPAGNGKSVIARTIAGTHNMVLRKIHNWADDPSRPERISWLHGPAGVGKSAIAQTIAHSYGQDTIGASFFFDRSDPSRNDGNRLFTTLAWQLALSVPIVKDLIASFLDEDPDLPRKNIETQFDRLIAQPFLTISGRESQAMRVIIIDGLDQCFDVKLQQRILQIIGRAVADPRLPLRFLISSRPEAPIEDFFAQFQYPVLQIDLAKIDDVSHDVETYLTSEFARIAVERDFDRSWPGQHLVQTLLDRSSGQFLYVATVIKLVGDPDNDPKTQLDIILGIKPQTRSLFAELDALYVAILQRHPDQDFLMTFLYLFVAHCSISEDGLSDNDAMLMDISRVELEIKLRRLRAILEVELHINVHHKSFLDFLEDSSRSGQYHVSRSAGMRRYLELITKLLIGHGARLTAQPDFHGSGHFAPEFGKLINRNPQAIELAIEDWEQVLRPFLNALDKLLEPSNIDSLIDGYCQECRFFQIAKDTLAHFQSLRERKDPDVEKCLESLEFIRYRQQNFHMNFGRIVFGSAAIFGFLMAILAHLDSNTNSSKTVAYEILTCILVFFIL